MRSLLRPTTAALVALSLVAPAASAVTTWDFTSSGNFDPDMFSFSLASGQPFRFLSGTMAETTFDFGFGCQAGPTSGTPVSVTGLRSSAPVFTTTFQVSCPPDPGTYLPFASPDTNAILDEMTVTIPGLSFLQGTLTVTAVPEPSTWALSLVGTGIVGFFVRPTAAPRRRRSGRQDG